MRFRNESGLQWGGLLSVGLSPYRIEADSAWCWRLVTNKAHWHRMMALECGEDAIDLFVLRGRMRLYVDSAMHSAEPAMWRMAAIRDRIKLVLVELKGRRQWRGASQKGCGEYHFGISNVR